MIKATALPSYPQLGLPSTLFYPRTLGLTNGFSVTRPRRPLLRSLNSSLYSSHHSTSTEHSTANAKDHALGQSPVTNNTGRTLSFLYVIASYNVIRQAAHAKGAVHHRTWTALVSPFAALIGLSEALKQRSKHKKRGRRR